MCGVRGLQRASREGQRLYIEEFSEQADISFRFYECFRSCSLNIHEESLR